MFKTSSHLLKALILLPVAVVLASCQSAEKKEDKGKNKPDRFAFLRSGQNRQEASGARENFESAATEKIRPENAERPVVSPEVLNRFNIKAPVRPAAAELAKPAPKFYEDFIALNGDEELEVSLVFNSAPLLDVLSAFGDLLGFNFVADSDLKGVVTLNLNSKMTRRELWNTRSKLYSRFRC